MSAPALRFEGTIRFRGQRLFPPITLDLVAGGWTCLLGTSGVGKSTILRTLAGLETGAVFEGRTEAGDGGPVAGRVAFMAQTDLLLPWASVRRNVTLGARLRGERPDRTAADRLIRQVGLADSADRRPAALSGGMRQRAALARTLMEDRPFVLLDEPFSALDAATRAEMQELAFETLQGRTKLLVTHDPAEAARLGDRILLLTADGLSEPATPETPPIRAADAREVLETQAALLRTMREAQAA